MIRSYTKNTGTKKEPKIETFWEFQVRYIDDDGSVRQRHMGTILHAYSSVSQVVGHSSVQVVLFVMKGRRHPEGDVSFLTTHIITISHTRPFDQIWKSLILFITIVVGEYHKGDVDYDVPVVQGINREMVNMTNRNLFITYSSSQGMG